jgi:membrane associated rhomboid family serine protease
VAKCDICGKEEYLPFKCKYCGGTFCAEHRLPEKHNCPGFMPEEREYWNVPVKVKRTRKPAIIDPVRKARGLASYGINNIILVICTIVFFVKILFGRIVDYYLALHPLLVYKMPWQLVTSIFVHSGFEHFFVNMFVLLFFGSELERRVGSGNYLKIFLISGIAGSLAYLAYAYLTKSFAFAMGASAAIFGIMGALAIIAPHIRVFVFPFPIPINIRTAILLFAAIDLFLLPFSYQTGIAHVAHLAGLFVGLYFGKVMRIKRGFELY